MNYLKAGALLSQGYAEQISGTPPPRRVRIPLMNQPAPTPKKVNEDEQRRRDYYSGRLQSKDVPAPKERSR